jgi:hypothetical protein
MVKQTRSTSIDQQMHDLLGALVTVVIDLETAHQEVEESGILPSRRQSLYEKVLSDMDRVANLLHLAESHSQTLLSEQTCRMMRHTLEDVRQRATAVGVGVALNRVRSLRRIADRSSQRHEHPLGKSFYLRDAFVDAVTLLRSLCDSLPQEHIDDLTTSAATINGLISRDRNVVWLQSFAQDEPCNLINLEVLSFRPQQEAEQRPSASYGDEDEDLDAEYPFVSES